MSKYRVRWSVDDGYVSGSRPHYSSFDELDLEQMVEQCATEDDVARFVEELVQEDFNERIGFTMTDLSSVVDAWRAAKAAKDAP